MFKQYIQINLAVLVMSICINIDQLNKLYVNSWSVLSLHVLYISSLYYSLYSLSFIWIICIPLLSESDPKKRLDNV